MATKKTKLVHKHKSKRLLKKMLSYKKTKKTQKNNNNKKNKNMKSYKKSMSKVRSKSKNLKVSKNIKHIKHIKHINHINHKGGFANCNLATIKEPGFSVDALGSIAGINIPDSRAAIFRPNCNTSTPQAMAP